MDDSLGYVILLAMLAYFGFQGWRGYIEAQKPAAPLRDIGNGVMEPVCPYCNSRLVTINRRGGLGFLGLVAILIGVIGFVLLLVNWISGAIVLILAVLLRMAGKSSQTVLTCPSCGRYDKTIE
jgi:hypothetical protein